MRLKDICTVFTDGDWIESKDQSDEGIRLIQTGNIGEGVYLEKEARAKYISEDTFEKLKCTEIYPGDILVSRLPEPVGRACIVPQKEGRMITAVDCTICRPDESIVSKEYLCYFMRSNSYYMKLLGNVTGTTRKRISRKNLENVKLDVPSKENQKEVVKQLDCLSKVIDLRNKELQLFDNLIKARFVELFGDPSTNPRGWDETTISDECFYIKDGPHKSLPDIGKENGGHPFISVRNIVNGHIDFSTARYISDEDYADAIRKCHPEKGDMLYSKGGTTGIAKLIDIDEEFANWVHVAVLKFDKSRLNGVFFENMLNCSYCYEQSQRLTKGIANRDLVLSAMAQIKLYCPPMELQNQFADFVKQVDKSEFDGVTIYEVFIFAWTRAKTRQLE